MNEIEHLFNQGHIIIFKWRNTENWPIEYVSENVSRIIGYSRDKILADNFVYSEIIHPDDLLRVVKEVSENSKSEIEYFTHQPYRIITKSNKILWVNDYTNILRNEKGEITHYIGYINEISERIKAEEQNKKLSTAVEQSYNCIVISDTEGNIEYVNPKFSELTGYKAKEVIGKNSRILNAGVYSKKYYKELWDTISSGKIWKGELCNKKKNGELYWEQATITPVKGDDGKITNYIALKEDITARKKAEEELRQRERYMSALNQVSTLFLKDDSIPYQRFVEIIGSASEASRTYIFINKSNEKNEVITSRIAEYCARGIKPEIANPELQNLSFNTWCKRCEKVLSKGEIISGKTSDFPQSERNLLEPQGIQAILIIPLVVDKEFYGFIGFDNCVSDREWTSLELEFLKVGANSLQRSIKKNKTLKLLQYENLRFRTTMDSIDAIVYVADLQTYELIFLNKYGENIFGDQIGNKCYKVFQKDKSNPCSFCTNKLLLDKSGNPKEPFVWELRNEISERWYQCSDQAIYWIDGRTVRFGIATDISERKRIEEELEKSEAKYRKLIEDSNDAIYLLYENKFEIINKKFCEMFGVTEQEVQDPDFDFIELVSPKSRDLIMERSKSDNKDKLESKYEFTALNRGGKELEVEASVSYMKYKKGVAVQGIIRDFTRRKQLEQRMLQSQKLESIGELAGGVSHDFNNILGSIYGYAELAIDKLTEESKIHYYVEQIIKSAEKGKDLVNHIMSFTRKGNMHMEDVNLGEIIKEGMKLIKPLLPSTIRIRQNIQTDQSFISGNPTHIYQILINLCTNASYAMGGNTGLIGITLEEISLDYESNINNSLKSRKYIRLIVSDTGKGISKDAQQKIFDPFFTTKPIGEGTGMGLSVVYRIVESHGGEISVHSEEGKGSVFTILFPKIEPSSRKNIEDAIPLVGGTERILFVDDEENIVEIFEKILTRAGYDVSATSSSRNAMKLFKKNKNKFDLVITDQTMPEITGIQLAKEIKKERKDLPIILCSGYSDDNLKFKSVEQNFEKFLNKPVKQIELLRSIRQALDKPKIMQ